MDTARPSAHETDEQGYILVVLLVGMAVAAIWMSTLLPAWRQQVQREREEDLIFIGEQYARSIVLYQMKNQGAFPPNIEALVSGHYLRKQWKDPITGEDFALFGLGLGAPGGTQPGRTTGPAPTTPQTPGRGAPGGTPTGQQAAAGVSGVRSRSNATSIKIYKNLQQHSLWPFDAAQMYNVMGYRPGQQPGRGGQPGQPGQGGPGRGGPGQGGPGQGGPGRGTDGRGGGPVGGPAGPLPPGRGGRGG
jgi:type II secretory pathway pseudopilin PulG